MSINKFGLSENITKSGASKEYIDSKFIVLTKRLEEKVDKNINYPLNMLGNKISSSFVPNTPDALVNKLYVDKHLSKIDEQFEKKLDKNINYPLNMLGNKISSSFVPNTPDALVNKLYVDKHLNKIDEQFEKKLDRTQGEMLSNLDMGGYKIIKLSNPVEEEEACNKRYTDASVNDVAKYTETEIKLLTKTVIENIVVKNSIGYIPILNSNLENKYGFKVTASSEQRTVHHSNKDGYNVFNFKNTEWITDGVNRDFFIQIHLPERIEVYKFALRGKNSGTDCIYKWKLQGSNNVYANRWETLYNAENEPVNRVTKYYLVQRNMGYPSYRIFVHEADGENPGLSYWQLFALDKVVTPFPTPLVE